MAISEEEYLELLQRLEDEKNNAKLNGIPVNPTVAAANAVNASGASLVPIEEIERQQQLIDDQRLQYESTAARILPNLLKNFGYGALKRVEGVIDYGTLLGAIAQEGAYVPEQEKEYRKIVEEFGGHVPTKTEQAQEAVKKDLTAELFGGVYAPGGNQFLQGITQSIGGIATDALVSLATMGIGSGVASASALKQIGSLASLGIGAAGNAAEEAYNDGASFYGGLGYGAASGATEVLAETLVGGGLEKIYGSGLLNKITPSAVKRLKQNAVVSALANSGGEGLEEVFSGVANPLLKTIYKGKEALGEYGTDEFKKGLATEFAAGAVTAGIVGGATGQYTKSNMVRSIVSDAQTAQTKLENKYATGKLTTKEANALTSEIRDNYKAAEQVLRSMGKDSRLKLFNENPGLEQAFRKDGRIRLDFARNTWGGEETDYTTEGKKAAQNRITDAEAPYVSVNARYRAETVRKGLDTISDSEGTKMEVFSGTLDTEQERSYTQIKRLVNNFNRFTGDNIGIVVTNESNRFNAVVPNKGEGNIIYIPANGLSETSEILRATVEEVTHTAQGVDKNGRYNPFYKFLLGEVVGTGEGTEITESLLAKNSGYGFSRETLQELVDSKGDESKLSKNASELLDEIGAKTTAKVLAGNQEFIDRYTQAPTVAGKLLGALKSVKHALSRMTSAEARAEHARVKAVEEQLLNALAAKGYTYKDGKVVVSAGEPEEKEENTRFNLKTWRNNAIMTENGLISGREMLKTSMQKIGWSQSEINKLVGDVDRVADFVEKLQKDFPTLEKFSNIKPHYRQDGSLMLSCVVSNGEYELNIDFTTICKRREALAMFLTEYVESGKDFGRTGFDKKAQTYLENLFKKYDLDSACTFCFVESRRKNVDTWSAKLSRMMDEGIRNAGMKDVKPISSVSDLGKIDVINGITDAIAFDVANVVEADAIETTEAEKVYNELYAKRRADGKAHAPNTEERIAEYLKNHAKDGKVYSITANDLLNVRVITYIKANMPDLYSILLTSYGANAPKQTLPATPYASDIFLNTEFAKEKNLEKKTAEIGGIRLNSFSDFQITRVLDYIQMVADATARRACLQTYTRELAQVRILGKSGLKQNMSLKPEVDTTVAKDHAGLDKDGNYIMSSDSVNAEEAFALQEQDGMKGDVGTVLVGISKYQILKALSDDRIKMIIPYHSSGMPKHLKIYFNHTLYTDYQSNQNTMRLVDGKLQNAPKDPFLQVFYSSYMKNNGNYHQATQDYLDYCKEHDLVPRFAFEWDANKTFEENLHSEGNYITSHPNYYKVLIDFTSDGGVDENGNQIYVPQKAVHLDLDGIDVEGIVRDELKKYESGLKNYQDHKFEMFDEFQKAVDGKINPLEMKKIRDMRISEENKQNIVTDDVGTSDVEPGNIRFSRGDQYSYESLTSKPDIKILTLQNAVPTKADGSIDRASVIAEARKNARAQNNSKNTATETYVRVSDIDRNVLLGAKGLQHGLTRGDLVTAKVTLKIGDILRSSVAVNELNGDTDRNTQMSYVLLGIAEDSEASYAVRSIVEQSNNAVSDISIYKLSAAKGKKIENPNPALKRGAAVSEQNSVISSGSHTISIAQLFDLVKGENLVNEVFSADVAEKLGVERANGTLSDSIRFSRGMNARDIRERVSHSSPETVALFDEWKKTASDGFPQNSISSSGAIYQEGRKPTRKDFLRGFSNFFRRGEQRLAPTGNGKDGYVIQTWDGHAWVDESVKFSAKIDLSLENANLAKELQGFVDGKGEYVAADILNAPEMKEWIKTLKPLIGKAVYRKDARETVARLKEFYNGDNELLADGYIDENVEDAIDFILKSKDSEDILSTEEMNALHVILAGMRRLYKTYDRITLAGKSKSLTDTAELAHDQVSGARRKSTTRTMIGKFQNLFSNDMIEPRVVIQTLEGFAKDGVLSQSFRDIQKGETQKQILYMQMMQDFDDFFKKNKKYKKRLFKEYIEFRGNKLSVGQAITLHELSKRDQAKLGLENEIDYVDKDSRDRKIKGITEKELVELSEKFNDQDVEFIMATERFFNEYASEIKKKADKQNLGYTNALEEFYFPIARDKNTIRKAITDSRSMLSGMISLYSYSFNKDVKKNAKNAIFVGNVWDVINTHAEQLSSYAALYAPMKTFEQLYNKNLAKRLGGSGVISVRQELNQHVWDGTDRYISNLMSDISGTSPTDNSTFGEIVRDMRGAYAKFQLGANVKTFLSQLASYPMALTELDMGSLIKGAFVRTNYQDMDKYCPYAKARNYNKAIVKAEGVIDQVGKVGDVLTKPIQYFDRLTIGKLWNACQYQVQRNNGLDVGTDENKVKAGELLEEVVRKTQPDFSTSERSALMRSRNELARSATMFSSAQLKQLSRLYESVLELRSAKTQEGVKSARRKLGRAVAATLSSIVSYALIGIFSKALFAKLKASDKEPDEKLEALAQEFGSDLLSGGVGILPIVRDIYTAVSSKVMNNGNGYEVNSFYYDVLNNVINSGYKAAELSVKAISGASVSDYELMSVIRNSTNAVGQLTGIPTRNLYNEITGLIKRVSPSAGYSVNAKFYNADYVADMNKAIENGNTKLAESIMNLMMSERMDGTSTSQINKSVVSLYKKGYNVLPRAIGDSITYDGEEHKLTARQKARFQKVYGQASTAAQKVVSLQTYQKATDEVKAKTLKRIYDMYYNLAVDDLLGTDTEDKTVLFSYAIDPDKLALIVAQAQSLQADTDKSGNPVSGSKKQKIVSYINGLKLTAAQKYMIMGYLGYRNENGEEQVKAYINRLGALSKAEKKTLFEYSGYAA